LLRLSALKDLSVSLLLFFDAKFAYPAVTAVPNLAKNSNRSALFNKKGTVSGESFSFQWL
jgi:hypothetical protein